MAKKKSETPEAEAGTEADEKRGTGETARRIWLAGVGAYGRAFTEAQEALKDVTGKTSDVFDDLVQKGEFIESAVSSKRKDLMKKAGVPSFDMEDRIAKMRSRLSRGEDSSADTSDLEARLDAMDAKLDMIIKLLGKPSKTSSRKTTATKRTSKK